METPMDKELWLANIAKLQQNTAMENLDIQLVDVGDEHILLSMPITNKTLQPMGLLHGGISMLLAETAASYHACWGIDLSKVIPVGIEINGSHVRSAREGSVRAEGKVLRRSRQFILHQVEIFHADTQHLLSTARVTNFYKSIGGGEES